MLEESDKFYFIINGIPLDIIYDAEGSPLTLEVKAIMKKEGKYFAYNTAPCKKGHKLKTVAGHCIECKKASIRYVLYEISGGYVYLAGSISGRLLKVGLTENIEKREEDLNRTKYANKNDWVMLLYVRCKNQGKVERKIKNELGKYSAFADYLHDSHHQEATEIFKCDYFMAREAFVKTKKNSEFIISEIKENVKLIEKYLKSVDN